MSPVIPPASLGTALVPEISADGTLLPPKLLDELVEARVQAAVRTIGRCTLRFRDPEYALADASTLKVGTAVVVGGREMAHNTRTTMFTGTITSVAYEQRPGQGVDLVVVAEDVAFRLSRDARAATYLRQSYSDVVRAILSDKGLRADVHSTTGVHEYLLQSDTDLRFIDEITQRLGWDWVVDPEGTFHFWDSWAGDGTRSGTLGGPVTLTAGEDLHSFSVKVWSDGALTANVRGWDHLEKQAVAGTATARPNISDDLRGAVGLSNAAPATVLDARSNPADQAEATAIATWRARGAGTVSVRCRAWGTPTMRPGVMVDLKGVGPAVGRYFVQEVRHLFNRDGLTTEIVAGDRESYGLAAAEAPEVSSFAHRGLVVAVVSNIRDPSNLGRVKVTFPGLGDRIESDWARVATESAGGDRGAVFIPSVNDQVLVGFEGGDARRPVVLGGLYSKKDQIPPGSVVDGVVESQRITSRTGHVIELNDSTDKGKDHILLAHSTKDRKLRIGKDTATLEVPSGVPIVLKSGNASITLDKNGGITIEGGSITIKGRDDVVIDGRNVTIKAQAKAELSTQILGIKAQAKADIDGGGMATIKGGTVMIN